MEPDITEESIALGWMAVRYRFEGRVIYHQSYRSSASVERYSQFVAGAQGVGLLEGNMKHAGLAKEEDINGPLQGLSSYAIVRFCLADHA